MALVLTSGPATEPVTVAEAKAHLRLDSDAEDVLIASLIITSRLHVEAALGLALIAQSWTLHLDAFPADGCVALPVSPVANVTAVRVLAADGAVTLLHPSAFEIDTVSRPPRLVRASGAVWPLPGKCVNGIEIAFTAGYGPHAADVPEPIRRALLLLVAHWYEHRDPAEIGDRAAHIPAAVSSLLEPYMVKRL